MRKEILIEALVAAFINKDLYNAETKSNNHSTRRKKQCAFQLMNILFSDEFADDFGGAAGDTPSWVEIDSGNACNNCGFWIGVYTAFTEPYAVYDKLQFSDDVHFVN